ncbi:MAG TPA: hypothetical protein VJN93_18350 [Candidatus Acidoferrum sp.]|nr:hypothetical protein [Candidatus Acidoferrum sp.]
MKRILALSVLLISVGPFLLAQSPTKPSFMDAAVIQHNGASRVLTANFPSPLSQAIEAISQEYGWTVDFEDPHYTSHFDLVDDTDPKWRANHPTAKGVVRVAGGFFQSNFPEPSTITTGDPEEQVLQKLVADYNASGNPGKFVVRKEAEGRYAVIGVSRKDENGRDEAVNALLDTPISIPVQQRDAKATLRLIVDTLSADTDVNVHLGTIGLSSDPLQEATLTLGGSNVPARTLLLQALDGISSTSPHFRGIFVWNFLFDADTNAYWLRIRAATKTVSNAGGRQTIQFLRYPGN